MAKKSKDNTEIIENIESPLNSIKNDVSLHFKGSASIQMDIMANIKDDIAPKGYVSTGDDILDLIISNKKNGGLPLGKFIDIYGDSSTGKSLIASCIMAMFHKAGGSAVYFDTERAAFPDFFSVLGVDMNKTLYIGKGQNSNAVEKIFEMIIQIIVAKRKYNDKTPMVIIVDSMTATNLESVLNDMENFGETGYQAGAKKQHVLGTNIMKALDYMKDEDVTFISINQVRDNLERANKFSPKFRSTSGHAQKFYSDIRLELSPNSTIKNKAGELIGHVVNVKTVKNKIAPAHRKTTIFIYSTFGLDNYKSWVETLKELKIVQSTPRGIKYEMSSGEILRMPDGSMPTESQLKSLIRTNQELRNEFYELIAPHFILRYERKGDEYLDDIEDDVVFEVSKGEDEGDVDVSSMMGGGSDE